MYYEYEDELLKNIKEMAELENGVSIENNEITALNTTNTVEIIYENSF